MNLDIIVPFYNEQECVQEFLDHLIKGLDQIPQITCLFYLVNDGSQDRTSKILNKIAEQDQRISVIHLLRNYGHQRALIAGLDHCKGDAVLMMDGDGQHPVKIAIEMVLKIIKHPDILVVQGVRKSDQEMFLKKMTSSLFYRIAKHLIREAKIFRGASDFRVMRREAINIIEQYPDRYRNLRILLSLLSLSTLNTVYNPSERLGGASKYSWRKMIRLASDGVFAYSTLPLRISFLLMTVSGILGIIYAIYSFIVYLEDLVIPGWTSIIALICLLFSSVFAVLTILSEYVNRIYEDVRGHPIYMISDHYKNINSSKKHKII